MNHPIGRLFCVGLSGQTLSDEDRRVLERGVGGVVLFARNVGTKDQVARLIEDARKLAGQELIACVDQEGGRVARLVDGFTRLPTMRALGEVADQSMEDAENLAYESGCCLGFELSQVGIDVNLAPVLDVDTNPKNPVIGDRSISRDATRVAHLGQKLIAGMNRQGIVACGKHFPGHGDTAVDSHYDLPRLPHALDRLRAVELLPFQHVIQNCQHLGGMAIMSAHVVFEALGTQWPGTLCREVMTGLLRDELGFQGLRMSDCLEMKAIADPQRGWGGTMGAAPIALEAGVDMALVSHTHEWMHGAIDHAFQAAEAGALSTERIEEALGKLKLVQQFRQAARQRDQLATFDPSDRFDHFVKSAAAAGDDPTWDG